MANQRSNAAKDKTIPVFMLGVGLLFLPVPWALAELPTGATVRAGNVSITPPTGNQLVINQGSPKAIIDWQGFSINRGNTVRFVHANSSDITLNRVTGTGVSTIDGNLLANGQVWLINPNGVLIGSSGQIKSTGFLTTTRSLADADFLANRYQFTDSTQPGSAIVNQGTITATNGGYIVLSGEKISNNGLLQADFGSVVLGGAKTFVLDLNGDKLLSFAITTPLAQLPADGTAIVNNSGTLQADGGRVLLTARAAADVIGSVVNTTGLIQANSVSRINGEVVLEVAGMGRLSNSGTITANGHGHGGDGGVIRLQSGGSIQMYGTISANADANGTGNGGKITVIADIRNPDSSTILSGSLSAQAGSLGGNGGFVETSGSKMTIESATRVNTSAPNGLMGTWLIDPTDLTIQSGSGVQTISSIGASTLANALATNNVTLETSTTSATSSSTSSSGGITQAGNIYINAPVSWASVNQLTLSAHGDIHINADISAALGRLALYYGRGTGAAGNTSAYNISQGVKVNLPRGSSFSTKLGSDGVVTNFNVITSANFRDFFVDNNFTGALNGAYALGSDIDATITRTSGFNPISPFSGIFDGLGHTISHLQINQTTSNSVGFFGVSTATAAIRNVGLDDVNISAPSYNAAITDYNNYLRNEGSNFVGGLVGVNFGTITNSYATGSVSSPLVWSRVGGLVGLNYGSVSDSYSTASVSGFSTGGLVGWNNGGLVTNGYAWGNVTGNGYVGGLVGWNTGSTGVISFSVAYGNVTNTGSYTSGDLVGMNELGGSIISSYAIPSGSTGSTGSTTDTTSSTTQLAATATTAAMALTTQQSAITGATAQLATTLLPTTATTATVQTALPTTDAVAVLASASTQGSVAVTTAVTIEPAISTGTGIVPASPVVPVAAVVPAVQTIAISASTPVATSASSGTSALTSRTTVEPAAATVTAQGRITTQVMASPAAAASSVVTAAPSSPVAAVKPPTPKDAADAGDKTLAAAAPVTTPTPVANAKRAQTGPRVVSLGLISIQEITPAKLPVAALTEQRFSLTGNRSTW